MQVGRFCINWKVLAALGAVGLGVFVLAPGVGRSLLPLLVLAACPLSMIFMMRGMRGPPCDTPAGGSSTQDVSPATVDELKTRLVRTQAEQDAIAAEIARIEASAVTAEAEVIVEKAEQSDKPDGPAPR